jgi:hypothetical protein
MTTCRIIQNNNSNVSLVPVREYLNVEDQMVENKGAGISRPLSGVAKNTIRSFSTKSSNPNNTNNLDLDKGRILQENTQKAVYAYLINGKRYVGSSENLSRRFAEDLNVNYLIRTKYMYICRAQTWLF